ncbi:MAG: A24 family peptidase C-terminal domain-containing protein [Sulfolobales archaeon]
MHLFLDKGFLGYIIALVMLAIGSYSDIKTREIDPKLWIFSGVIASIIYITRLGESDLLIYTLLSLLAPLLVFLLAFLGFMGYADFFAFLVLVFLIPKPLTKDLILPPLIIILLLSDLILLFYSLPMSIASMRYYSFVAAKCSSHLKTLLIIFTGYPQSIKKYLMSKYMFPLVYPVKEGSETKWICRSTFDIEEEPEYYKDLFKKLIDEDPLLKDQVIIVSWGAPYVFYVFLGVLIYPFVAQYIEELFAIFSKSIFILLYLI